MVWQGRTHLQGLSLSSTRSGLTPEGMGWRLARCWPHFFAPRSWSDFAFMIWSSSNFAFFFRPKLLLCNSLLIEMLYTPLHPMQCYLLPLRKIRKFTIIAITVCQKGNGQGGKRLFHISFAPFFFWVDNTMIHNNLNWGKSQRLEKGKTRKCTSSATIIWSTQIHAKIDFR